jgi:NitT/TauT family transport system ATP-binding protein
MMAASLPYVQIAGLCHTFGQQVIFDRFQLHLTQGQFTSLVGANGCGKSTLMSLLAGVMRCDRGQIAIDQQPLQKKRVGYVFQNYRDSLFPWLTVRENLLYPLKLQRLSPRNCQQRLEQLTSIFEIKFDLSRYPYQLSGGQQQFVAILRALMVIPDVLLLDEPFSSLDLEMTLYMRDKLDQVCQSFHFTTVMVSHDLDNVVYLADRIIMLSQRPAQILADIPVPISHPRTAEVLIQPEFIHIKQHCLDRFLQENQR